MKYFLVSLISSIILIITTLNAFSDDNLLINLASEKCQHGLHSQPKNGYSIFVFCDDALGTNIGIILSKRGVFPADSKQPNLWGTTKRFWQDGTWATDVQDIFWSPSGKYIYVSTSGVYGDGGLFELDLEKKKFSRLFPTSEWKRKNNLTFLTKIVSYDANSMKIEVGLYDVENDKRISKVSLPIR